MSHWKQPMIQIQWSVNGLLPLDVPLKLFTVPASPSFQAPPAHLWIRNLHLPSQ